MRKNNKKPVDYKTLNASQLREHIAHLEKEALNFDVRLSSFMWNTRNDDSPFVQKKLERLWDIAFKMWSQIAEIEKWRKVK